MALPLNVRIVESNYSQTLLRVVSIELTNTDITTTHANGDVNTASFESPASIFLMLGRETIDHIKK